MSRWDDPREWRHDAERDHGGRDARRDRGGPAGDDRRAFQEDYRRPAAGRFGRGEERRGRESWSENRAGARYDQERTGYGLGPEDAGAAGYASRRGPRDEAPSCGDESFVHGGEPWAYAGQEYGVEGHGFGGGAESPGPAWAVDRNSERVHNFDFDDPGVGQSQAGYGLTAQTLTGQEFDPDYLRWREEQLRAHDRDYQDWRREQQRQYDEQYRQFRSERQRHFGQAFHEWRSQRSAGGGETGGQEQRAKDGDARRR